VVPIADETSFSSPLTADFGFQHILWVYSGRRGIHAWISDASALELTDEQRSAIVRYIDVIKGYTTMDKKVQLSRPLHPALRYAFSRVRSVISPEYSLMKTVQMRRRAYRNLKPAFDEVVLTDQDCFRTDPAQWEGLLKLLPDRGEQMLPSRALLDR